MRDVLPEDPLYLRHILDAIARIETYLSGEEATVREWIGRFEAEGRRGLKDRPGGGRPRRADAAAPERLRRTVQAGPQGHGPTGA